MDEAQTDDRRHWGRMVLLGVVGIFIVLFVIHLIWTIGARNRLNALAASYKAAGEPIEPGDFVAHGVTDADNAAVLLRAAADSIDRKSKAWKRYDEIQTSFQMPLTNEELAALRGIVAEDPKAAGLVDRAMRRGVVDWQVAMKSPVTNVLLPHLTSQRNLANLLGARVLVEHEDGDDAGAVADVRRLLFVGRAMEKHPLIVGHLVAVGIRWEGCDRAAQIATGLKIGDGKEEVSPAAVKGLIDDLLDERAVREGQRLAWLSERMVELDSSRSVADGMVGIIGLGAPAGGTSGVAAEVTGYLIRPMALQDGTLMLRQTSAVMSAGEKAQDWPTYKSTTPARPQQLSSSPFLHALASVMMPSMDRMAEVGFRVEVDGRMAAVSLAGELYRHEHGGTWPKALGDLVPTYLPSVPADAMAVNQSLKYANKDGNPIVYSVGENGVDDGGSEVAMVKHQMSPSKWQEMDVVTHLTTRKRKAEE